MDGYEGEECSADSSRLSILAAAIKHRKYIARETAVGTLINGLLSFGFATAVAHGRTTIPLWGAKGIAVDFLPQTFTMMFAMTLVVTLLARKRLYAGQVLPMPSGSMLAARLPQSAFLRALAAGLVIALVLSSLSAGLLHVIGVDQLSARAFVAMKTIYGAAVTALIAPAIVRAALVSMNTPGLEV